MILNVERKRLKKLVVVGNGMAGARVVEEILKRSPDQFDIVMFGAEPYGNYNRILLSNVLNGSQQATDIFINPLSWYRDNNIRLHAGVKASHIDRKRRVVVGAPLKKDALAYSADAEPEGSTVIEEPYDHVIIATGSRPFVPPMEGFGGTGTFLFRTIDDCSRIAECAKECRRAAVIGGGLLGLEAARGSSQPRRGSHRSRSRAAIDDGPTGSRSRRHAAKDDRSHGHSRPLQHHHDKDCPRGWPHHTPGIQGRFHARNRHGRCQHGHSPDHGDRACSRASP